MKLTMIMYLHGSVNRKALRTRNSGFWLSFWKFLDYIKNRDICHVLPRIASLVGKVFVQIGSHLGEYFMKNHPK